MKQPGESPGWLFSISARFVLASNLNVAWGPIKTGSGTPVPLGGILFIYLKRKKKNFLRFFYNFCDCVFETSKKDPFRGGEACSSAIFSLLVVSWTRMSFRRPRQWVQGTSPTSSSASRCVTPAQSLLKNPPY
jgi:hypothetical protein